MKHPSTLLSLAAVVCSLSFAALPGARAAQIDINGPPGSGAFGTNVIVLPNGNFVVTDPGYDAPGPIADVGAVYLYDGATLAVISTLTGSTASDQVGSGGVTVLSNGNYVVRSTFWNGSRGAVTWGNGMTGVSGVVSAANSLVGSTANDQVGSGGVTVLSNGNYVVRSPVWNNGPTVRSGAVTWGSGTTGVSGAVSAANSLVSHSLSSDQQVGSGGVTALNNGNYVVSSPFYDNVFGAHAGAVTWASGTTGVTGLVSVANSLVGSRTDDQVGNGGVTALVNGNYVVRSPLWDRDAAAIIAGAVTWGSGTTGVKGVVSAANSLVGSTPNDQVGSGGVTVLNNGNYVVRSPLWDRDAAAINAGAVTWGSGTTGVSGPVSAANSLVGSTANERVGSMSVTALNNGSYLVVDSNWGGGRGVVTWGSGTSGVSGALSAANSLVGTLLETIPPQPPYPGDTVGMGGVTVLSNGNYVVRSTNWNGARGAVTWGSGTSGVSGAVAAANSLVGNRADDQVGSGGVTALNNGNYVVNSPRVYFSGMIFQFRQGAVTWGSGTTGVKGLVSSGNSLVGGNLLDSLSDNIGSGGVTALNNGNYVVSSPFWNSSAALKVGAVTWCRGTNGLVGLVSAANSLVGNAEGDHVGSNGVVALSNGNYVVISSEWNASRGAVTWSSGTNGMVGVVSAANSLIGSVLNDQVGSKGVTALSNGTYVVRSPNWDNGAATDAGAVTWGSRTTGVKGLVSSDNSLVGGTANDQVGSNGVFALNNGNYVVCSPNWDNGAATDAGAVTWGSGTTGVKGLVSSGNSLVGGTANDQVGSNGVFALNNGNYMVSRPDWDNGATPDAGAVSLGEGPLGTSGAVTAANSFLGTTAAGGMQMNFAYDYFNSRLVVGYPAGNRVSLFAHPLVIVIARVPQGVRLRFSGVPGRTYTIERAPAITGSWSTLNTQTVPPSDLIQLIEHIDTTPPPGQAFYRVRQP